MAIAQFVQHQGKRIFILGLIVLLAACGGGGGKKDSKPDAFSFTAVTNAAVTTEVISAPITVAGIDKDAAISIANGTYSVNDGAFVATAGTVTLGQTVKVKVSTAATTNTAKVATLTIGGTVGAFSVTTAPDITPDAFIFTPATGAGFGELKTSNAITVSGIDVATPISIQGGTYSINGGAYVSTAGTVSPNQTVTLKAAAAASAGSVTSAILTIGGVTGAFTVTLDDVAPLAKVMFPPAVSLSNGATIKVRGTASDTASGVAGVMVGAVAAVSTDGYATWTAEVPLIPSSTNSLNIVTTDKAGVSKTDQISVKQVANITTANTPDANILFSTIQHSVIDAANQRMFVTDSARGAVIAVNLSTGQRTIFSDSTIPNANVPFANPRGIVLDNTNNRLLVTDVNLNAVVAVSLADGSRTFFSGSGQPDNANPFQSPFEITLDIDSGTGKNRALVLDDRLVAVDLSTAVRTILSSSTTPDAVTPFSSILSVVVDRSHNRLLVADYGLKSILSVNPSSGARSIFSSNSTQAGGYAFSHPYDTELDEANNRLLVTDFGSNALIAVSLTTGVRTLISDNTTPNTNNSISPTGLGHISLDAAAQVAFLTDDDMDAIFAVDAITGERVVFSK